MQSCECGHRKLWVNCCLPIIRGERQATTCEHLMRARFSAYVRRESSFLIRSWHPATRPPQLMIDPDIQWQHLEIVSSKGGLGEQEGQVEFIATYLQDGREQTLHELSYFIRLQEAWHYFAPLPMPE